MYSLEKESVIFVKKKTAKDKLAVNRYQLILLLDKVFSTSIVRLFWQNQKTFKFGEIKKHDEERVYFLSLKVFLTKMENGKCYLLCFQTNGTNALCYSS